MDGGDALFTMLMVYTLYPFVFILTCIWRMKRISEEAGSHTCNDTNRSDSYIYIYLSLTIYLFL